MFEIVNARELRVMFGAYSKRSWLRLMCNANKINLLTQSSFDAIRECIMKFKPLQLLGKNDRNGV